MSDPMRNAEGTPRLSPHAVGKSRHSDFRGLLLLPALVWFAGLVVCLANRGATSVGHDRGIGGVD